MGGRSAPAAKLAGVARAQCPQQYQRPALRNELPERAGADPGRADRGTLERFEPRKHGTEHQRCNDDDQVLADPEPVFFHLLSCSCQLKRSSAPPLSLGGEEPGVRVTRDRLDLT